jgi:dienelactone hydrolase
MACAECLVAHRVAAAAAGADTLLAGAPCYATPAGASPDAAGAAAAAGRACIVVFTDVFGHALPNVRVVADAISRAAGGLPVFVPDVLAGDAIAPEGFDRATFPAWRERHSDAQARPLCEAAVAALRAAGFARVGAIGYCWGGRYAALAAAAGIVDCYAVAHPSFTTPADYAALGALPGFFALAEADQAFPAEAAAEVEAALRAAGAQAEFRRYPGTTHGFAVRPPPESAAAAEARDDAAAGAGHFFRRFLLVASADAVVKS